MLYFSEIYIESINKSQFKDGVKHTIEHYLHARETNKALADDTIAIAKL